MNTIYTFQVGNFTCNSMNVGHIEMPTQRLVPTLSDTEFAEARERYGLPPGNMRLSFTAILVDTGSHRVLIDSGMGHASPGTSRRLPDGMRIAGVEPESLQVVVISHSHIDHVGGLVGADGAPAFPNAAVAISRAEWDFWASNASRMEKSNFAVRSRELLARVHEQVQWLEPGEEVVPGVIVHDGAGHTPGHLVVEVISEGERLWVLGDLIFHSIHVEHPEWPAAPDHDKTASVAARQIWLPRLANGGDLAHAFHMPFPALGRVRTRAGDWKWEPQTP